MPRTDGFDASFDQSMIEHFLATFDSSFTLYRDLGSGPYFHSYLVTDKQSGARRYLSILSPKVCPHTSNARAFLQLLKEHSIGGSGLLQIAQGGFLAQESFYYLSNELSPDAVSLQEYVQNESPSAHRISQIGADCCRSLVALHSSGKVHGGLVPGCVVIDNAGVYLANAGVSTALYQFGTQTPDFQLLESRYTSPEQILTGHATPQSDIYSLGAILYHLLTGKPPFGGRTTAALMASVLVDEGVADAVTGSQEPGYVASAILRAIEKSPSDRWISAQQFSDALLRVSSSSGSRLPTSSVPRRSGCFPGFAFFSATFGYVLYHFLAR